LDKRRQTAAQARVEEFGLTSRVTLRLSAIPTLLPMRTRTAIAYSLSAGIMTLENGEMSIAASEFTNEVVSDVQPRLIAVMQFVKDARARILFPMCRPW
jgi:hypothetical protein